VIPESKAFAMVIAPWRGEKMREWNDKLIKNALKLISHPSPVYRQPKSSSNWRGNQYYRFKFKELEEQTYRSSIKKCHHAVSR